MTYAIYTIEQAEDPEGGDDVHYAEFQGVVEYENAATEFAMALAKRRNTFVISLATGKIVFREGCNAPDRD